METETMEEIITKYYGKASTLTIQELILNKTGIRIPETEIDLKAIRLGFQDDDRWTNPGPRAWGLAGK
jgi:hypothetical protein